MSGAADAPAAGGAAGGGGGGSNKLLLIVVLAFNVLIAAGLGYQVVVGQGKAAAGQGKADEHGAGDEKEAHPAPQFGPLVEVGSMVANMSGPLSGHYAKVFIHVEVPDEKAKPRVEAALVPMRAEALLFLSNMDLKETEGQDQIRHLAEMLKEKFNALLGGKETVKRVYFSEFVIQ